MNTDEAFMMRAIELARLGQGQVSPNPMVGCVIVHEGMVIGEGWHQRYGEAHAEVNAIRSVGNKELLRESTLYVTLEPCSHFGKTPPCTDLILGHGIQRVVIANLDSNPNVSGRGAGSLGAAGLEVVTGVLHDECRRMNRRFFTFVEQRRPYIILKWAESTDGIMAGGPSKWISNAVSRQWVHRWRTEEDSVLVGTRTAEVDNPRLDVRDWTGRNPVRIVIDRNLRLDRSLQLFDQTQKTICYNVRRDEEGENTTLVCIDEGRFVPGLVEDLYKRNIQSVIVEGGATTLGLFIGAGLWDEARVFRSGQRLGSGIRAPLLKANLATEEDVSGDTLSIYYPVDGTQ